MGKTSGSSSTRGEGNDSGLGGKRYTGPRNPDGTWMAGVVRGSYKPFPFPIGFCQGSLTVIDWQRHTTTVGRSAGWHPIVRCNCGWEGRVDRHNFKADRTTRCNTCAKGAADATRKKYWGYEAIVPDLEHRQRLLNRIASILARCHTKTSKVYPSYGGRGIAVHEPWRTNRADFLRYLISLPGWDDPAREIDRVDNGEGYKPGNLRFATRSENMRNRRSVNALQTEIADLRHRLRRAEQQIHDCDKCRSAYRP